MSVIISSDLVLAADAETVEPLTNARICYQTFTSEATATAVGSTEASGFEADSVMSPTTYEFWKATAIPATLTITFDEAKTCNYFMVAAHSIGSSSCAYKLQYFDPDTTTWTDITSESIPADDSTIIALFTDITASQWRVNITSGSTIPAIGVVYIGQSLDMQRGLYGGHSPINLSRQTEIRPTQSEGGNWLGRSIVRRGLATSFKWQNLKADWYRQNFDPFVKSARTRPFGIAWRPSDFPNECAYCWIDADIQPSNQGTRDYMSVSMAVKATEYQDG